MKNSYKIIFSGFILIIVLFSLSPLFTLQSINKAIDEKDKAQWQTLIKTKVFQESAHKLLIGLADLKMYAEMKQNPAQAMMDNTFAKQQIPRIAAKFSDMQGIKHLLCGEITNDPHAEITNKQGCWQLDGELSWQSLTRTKITFNNPETNWKTSLILERVGIFQWQAIDIELPVDAIIERFAKSVGLKEKSSIK